MTKKNQFDLKANITKFKEEFESKFNKNESSDVTDRLKDFKYLAILGQGAFGVVVRWLII